jgi:hypothetical protein
MRELVRIGQPAVPELTAELCRAEHWLEKSLIAFILRAIGDERAVPTRLLKSPRLWRKSPATAKGRSVSVWKRPRLSSSDGRSGGIGISSRDPFSTMLDV